MQQKAYQQHLFISIFHNPVTAWVVLAVSLGITIAAYWIAETFVQQRALDRFNFRVGEITRAIEDRLNVYEQVLWGAVGLHNASNHVSREEFKLFVDTLDINQHWPGIQGVGYAIPIAAADKDDIINSIRAEGFPEFSISPSGLRDEYSTIIYLEPFDWRNRRAFGYDMWSNDMRREAMARARDTGTAATSGLITLVQETEQDIQRGFLTYLPVYSSKNIPSTLEQKRELFQGWVYAPFRAGNLMQGILGDNEVDIDLEIYDGTIVSDDTLLFDSNDIAQQPHDSAFSDTVHVTLQGRDWTLVLNTADNFEIPGSQQPLLIASAGLVVDSLLFYLIYSLYFVTRRAQSLSNEWRLIIEQAPNALITTDAEGNIVMTNERADELFGYERQELIGQGIEQLVPDSIREKHPALRESFLRSPQARDMGAGRELWGRRKDGSEVPVEIGLNPLTTQQGNFVVAAVVDITERQRSQQRLQEVNNQMLQKNQEMEQFIYTVSHDLKSPLVTISGFAKRLQDSLADKLDDKQLHQLGRIKANVQHMEVLLNDLLQLSRVIRQDLEKTNIDSKELFNEVLTTLEGSIKDSDTDIEVLEPLCPIYGNERLVYQCVQNLVANAIQYRHPERTPEITIRMRETAKHTQISVSDNGIGIEERHTARVFRIFERLNPGEGTGVGLAIVKTVMEKHAGQVILDSEFGKGSTFSLKFPKQQQQ